jgi:CheY-like chemotaxis protein
VEPRRTAGVVLVAEDQAPVRQTVCRSLVHAGYDVFDAEDGVAALALAATLPHIDVLLTDLVMPRMGGRVLAEQLVVARPAIKIVYMTGYANDTEVARELRDGSRRLLQKPFRAEALVAVVRGLLHGGPE